MRTNHTAAPAENPDLLALGRRLEAVLIEWSALLAFEAAATARFERAVLEATGIALERAPDDPRAAYWQIRRAMVARFEANPVAKAEFELEQTVHRIDRSGMPLALAIDEIEALTVDGLAVKARATAFCNPELWDDGGYPAQLARLIENLWRVAGVAPIEGLRVRRLNAMRRGEAAADEGAN